MSGCSTTRPMSDLSMKGNLSIDIDRSPASGLYSTTTDPLDFLVKLSQIEGTTPKVALPVAYDEK
jgi:hypothetical protein